MKAIRPSDIDTQVCISFILRAPPLSAKPRRNSVDNYNTAVSSWILIVFVPFQTTVILSTLTECTEHELNYVLTNVNLALLFYKGAILINIALLSLHAALNLAVDLGLLMLKPVYCICECAVKDRDMMTLRRNLNQHRTNLLVRLCLSRVSAVCCLAFAACPRAWLMARGVCHVVSPRRCIIACTLLVCPCLSVLIIILVSLESRTGDAGGASPARAEHERSRGPARCHAEYAAVRYAFPSFLLHAALTSRASAHRI
jgi:hypothetical protein